MLDLEFSQYLERLLGVKILKQTPLTGGSINEVIKLDTTNCVFALKLNSSKHYPKMFEKEAKGLHLLAETNSFKIPTVIEQGYFKTKSFLILEYIPTGQLQSEFWEYFAQSLAQLHKNTSSSFGLDHDNYIGSLPQSNSSCATASDFYITQRLEPQFKRAIDNGYVFQNVSSFYNCAARLIPNEQPALIHGDLWNGNYLVSSNNKPVLIDPAVAYSLREMDLAMMKLFGGFPAQVFNMYNSIFPLSQDWQERIALFQLYYVLVHVNLFGGSYYDEAQQILNAYS